jgi:hypothetical protein
MTSFLSNLLARGYFPKELPPPFNTRSFGTFSETAPVALPLDITKKGMKSNLSLASFQISSSGFPQITAPHAKADSSLLLRRTGLIGGGPGKNIDDFRDDSAVRLQNRIRLVSLLLCETRLRLPTEFARRIDREN